MRNICVFTGTRAEYGILKPLLYKIKSDDALKLLLIVSGSHLSKRFGDTVTEIINDGFYIENKIPILTDDDSSSSIGESMGKGITEYSKALAQISPDLLVLLGDRYEALSMAIAAMVNQVPIAHIHGGEATYGVMDEAIRHSITKMSHLHFTATDSYRQRVIQLGEHPRTVFNVGSLGVENIKTLKLMTRNALEDWMQFSLGDRCGIVTFHPVQTECQSSKDQLDQLFDALDNTDLNLIFTKANADPEGQRINEAIDQYVSRRTPRCCAFESLGQLRYLSALAHVNVVIGNSSSGIIEAPQFKTPTVNIGSRQLGRVQAKSIVNCEPHSPDISRAIQQALSKDFISAIADTINPYEGESTSNQILNLLKSTVLEGILVKHFYDL